MVKRKKHIKLNYSETLFVKLQTFSLAKKSNEDDKIRAKSLLVWFKVNNYFTPAQISLAKKLTYVAKNHEANKKHYIYAISNGEQVKLGMSSDVSKRLKALQTSSPSDLLVLWKYYVSDSSKGAIAAERKLHRACKKYKIRGEWFECGCMDIVKHFSIKKKARTTFKNKQEDDLFTITNQWISDCRTGKGGWTKKQLNALGLSWPVTKGWKKTLIGKRIDLETKTKFES